VSKRLEFRGGGGGGGEKEKTRAGRTHGNSPPENLNVGSETVTMGSCPGRASIGNKLCKSATGEVRASDGRSRSDDKKKENRVAKQGAIEGGVAEVRTFPLLLLKGQYGGAITTHGKKSSWGEGPNRPDLKRKAGCQGMVEE